MVSPFRRNVELSGQAVRRHVSERFTEPNGLRAALSRAQSARVYRRFESDGFGRAEIGRALLAERFEFAGHEIAVSARTLWRAVPPSSYWKRAAHSFDWLEHLAALGDPRAADIAAAAVAGWLDRHENYDPMIWRADIAARRLRNWILHADFFLSRSSELGADRIAAIERSIWAHADWLMRRIGSIDHGVSRLRCAIAVATAGLAIEEWAPRRGTISNLLEEAIQRAVLADGGAVSRSPEDALTLCTQLRLLGAHCDAVQEAPPVRLASATGQLTRAVRFFRAPDGGLSMFHGGGAADDGRVDTVLAFARAPIGPQHSLAQSGFERLHCGRVTVMMDVGGAPNGAEAETVHGSTLAIELFAGRRRLVVNCGSGAHLDDNWRRACRGPAAHSTMVLDGEPFARPVLSHSTFGGQEDLRLVGPPTIARDRKDELNGSWALGAHDGYLESHGVSMTRRLFLSADGGDFRGEDRLSVDEEGRRAFDRRIGKLPRAARENGLPFVARFHLHPDVSAAIVADGEAITLRLPHGEVWVMRQVGGVLALERSIYIDHAEQPRSTRQIVVSGHVKAPGAQIRWAFRRVGDVSQLPKDIDALLPASRLGGGIPNSTPNSTAPRAARRSRRREPQERER